MRFLPIIISIFFLGLLFMSPSFQPNPVVIEINKNNYPIIDSAKNLIFYGNIDSIRYYDSICEVKKSDRLYFSNFINSLGLTTTVKPFLVWVEITPPNIIL